MEETIEKQCANVRKEIEELKGKIVLITQLDEFEQEHDGDSLQGNNIPTSRKANMKANLTLAFRHLEDARMRLGKAMQAYQGGISIFDRKEA